MERRPGMQEKKPSSGNAQPPLHDMNRVVSLFAGRDGEKKYYMQGVELNSDGKPPTSPQDAHLARWDVFFCQLTGNELSLWNAREMEAAAARGESIGPAFLRIADSFVSAVDPKSIVPAGQPPPSAPYVFSLNNAGANRILFAPMEDTEQRISALDALRHWLNCIRLAEWETGRLCEIYTGTLIGLRPDIAARTGPTLVKGRLEEPVQVRLPGSGTEWVKAFMVVSDNNIATGSRSSKRLSFQILNKSQTQSYDSGALNATIGFYASKKSKKPFFSFQTVIFAAAVYPDNPSMIPMAHTLKIEGLADWDVSGNADTPSDLDLPGKRLTARMAAGKGEDHAAVLVMPDGDIKDKQTTMLNMIMGICEAFRLWGKQTPDRKISFNPRDPVSPYFAFPIGPNRDRLFFDVPTILAIEPWVNKPTQIRRTFQEMMCKKMLSNNNGATPKASPQLPRNESPVNANNVATVSNVRPVNGDAPDSRDGQQNQRGLENIATGNTVNSANVLVQTQPTQERRVSENAPTLDAVADQPPVVAAAENRSTPELYPGNPSTSQSRPGSANSNTVLPLDGSKITPNINPSAKPNRYLQQPQPAYSRRSSGNPSSSEVTPNPSTTASSAASSPRMRPSALAGEAIPKNHTAVYTKPVVPVAAAIAVPTIATAEAKVENNSDAEEPMPSRRYSTQAASPPIAAPVQNHAHSPERPKLTDIRTDENTLGLRRPLNNEKTDTGVSDSPSVYTATPLQPQMFAQRDTVPVKMDENREFAAATHTLASTTPYRQSPTMRPSLSSQMEDLPAPIEIISPTDSIQQPGPAPTYREDRRLSTSDLQHDSDALAAINYLSLSQSPKETHTSVMRPAQAPYSRPAVPEISPSNTINANTHLNSEIPAAPQPISQKNEFGTSSSDQYSDQPHVIHTFQERSHEPSTLSSLEKDAASANKARVEQPYQDSLLENRPNKPKGARRQQRTNGNWSSDQDAEGESDEEVRPVVSQPAVIAPSAQHKLDSRVREVSAHSSSTNSQRGAPQRKPSRTLPIPPGHSNGLDRSTNSQIDGFAPARSTSSLSQTSMSERQGQRPQSYLAPYGYDPRFMGMFGSPMGGMPSMGSFYNPGMSEMAYQPNRHAFQSTLPYPQNNNVQPGPDQQQGQSSRVHEGRSWQSNEPLGDSRASAQSQSNGLSGPTADTEREQRGFDDERGYAQNLRQSMTSPSHFNPMMGYPGDMSQQHQHFAMQAAQQAAQQAYFMTMQNMYASMGQQQMQPMMGPAFNSQPGSPMMGQSPFMFSGHPSPFPQNFPQNFPRQNNE